MIKSLKTDFVQLLSRPHSMSALGHKRTCAVQKVMSRFTPESGHVHCNSICPLSAKSGHQRTSSRSCPTCFSWAVLQALEQTADDARITFTIALHGKHAREMLVEHSHRYHSISHGWGATDNPHDWEDAIAPLAKAASEGGRSRQSPLECRHHWALSSAYLCRVHWAVHTWERGQPREPLSRTGRCSVTALPPSRPFCQSRSGDFASLELVLNFYQ